MTQQTPNEWTKLTSISSRYEADLLAARLEELGIETRLLRPNSDPSGWLRAYGGSGPFEVHVPADAVDEAQRVIAGLSSEEPGEHEPRRRSPIELIGRALIITSLIALVVSWAWDIIG